MTETIISKDYIKHGKNSMPLQKWCDNLHPPITTSRLVLPSGIRAVFKSDKDLVFIYEQPPQIRNIRYIAARNDRVKNGKYPVLDYAISLPWTIYIIRTVGLNPKGMRVQVFPTFSMKPYSGVDQPLYYTRLPNIIGRRYVCWKIGEEKFHKTVNKMLAEICSGLQSAFSSTVFNDDCSQDSEKSFLEYWHNETIKDKIAAQKVGMLSQASSVNRYIDVNSDSFSRLKRIIENYKLG